ncbi:MAG: aldose epimerase family protein [Verrucomicrobiota bacterium]
MKPRCVILIQSALAAGLTTICFVGCVTMSHPKSSISKANFGKLPDGKLVDIYTLRNSKGTEARIITYGGIVQSLKLADRNGKFDDIVLGYDDLAGYLSAKGYFGPLIGRYANRIGGAKFSLDGRTYTLAANNNGHSLHGGKQGFDKVVWQVAAAETGGNGPELKLTYLSPDGEEGFPGNLNVVAEYSLTEEDELRLKLSARTDRATVVNLTQHSFFNLRGQGNGDVLDHEVMIHAAKTTPVDKGLIPTGEFADVSGTPFDFRKPATIGSRINDSDPVLQYGSGYNHNWIIDKPLGQYGLHARVVEHGSGRTMEVWSEEPGLQFYAGNSLDGSVKGKGGVAYQSHAGFCMEPQHYPDSPNKPQFPSVVLKPGETYHNIIIYKFSVLHSTL